MKQLKRKTTPSARFAGPPKPAPPSFASAISFLTDREEGRGAVQRLVHFGRHDHREPPPPGDDRQSAARDRDPGDGGDRAGALRVGGTGRARARPSRQAGRGGADTRASFRQTKQIRSGDLGEIYATEWIDAHSGGYRAPIKRLRWKDHRNMAMRGDDVIGILQDAQTQRLHFLKTEAKSRVDAHHPGAHRSPGRAGQGRRTAVRPRAVLHLRASARVGNLPLADAIDDALLKHGIPSRASGICSSPFPAMRRTPC